MIKQLRYLCTLLLMAVVGVAWGDTVTFDATVDVTEDATSYQTTEKSYTASDGSVWKANGYGANANTNLIIGKGGANYLETPEVAGVISSVTVTWSGNASYYLALQTISGTELEAKQNVSGGQEYTFNVTGSYSQLRLVGRRASGTSNAAATITKVVVTYSASSLQENDLTLTPSTLSLDLGGTSSAQISNSGNANGEITWTSSNTAVATVDANGNVTAVEIGKATITAEQAASDTYKGGNATCEVTVSDSRYSISSLVFEAKCNGSGTADDGNTWTITSDGTESTYDATSGIHYGTNNASVTYLQLASSSNNGTIKKVLVNARDAQENATISVTVGGTAFTCTTAPKATNLSSDYVFTGSAKGEIIVRIERTESMVKAIYVKQVDVYFEPSLSPQITASDVDLDYDATSGSITYRMTNEVDGGVVTASTDSEWLTVGTPSDGTVALTCDANNETTARTATVSLTYTYGDNETVTKDVTVTQAALPASYTTIPDLFDAATSTATVVKVTFGNWVVSGVSTNGKNVFVTDNIGDGFVIFNSGGGLDEIFAVGDVLSGTAVECNLVLYNGFAEVTGLDASDLTITSGGTVTAANVTMDNLSGVNTGALVNYENLTCSVNDNKYYLSDGTNTLQVYNTLFAFEALEDGEKYNITGVYQQYNNTKEILPRSADDIFLVVDNREAAGIAFSPATLTITQGDTEYTKPEFVNPNDIALEEISFTSSNANIADWDDTGLVFGTETGTATITATFEGNTTYKPATATLVVTVKKDLGFVEVVEGNGIYEKITSSNKLEAGHRYLVVYEVNDDNNTAEILNDVDNSKSYGLFATGSITNNRIDNTAVQAKPVVLQEAGDGNWFLMIDDDFLYVNTDGNYLNKSDDYTTNGIAWNIDFDAEHLIRNTYLATRFLMMNKGANPHRFSCYKGTQQDVVLYKELQENPVLIGDVNKDGKVTIADVTALVNILLGKDDTTPYQYDHEAAADVDGEPGITVADVEALVNLVLKQTNE